MGVVSNGIWIVLIGLISLLYIGWKIRSTDRNSLHQQMSEDRYTVEALISFVKHTMHELSRGHLHDWSLSEEAYRRRTNQRAELKKALKGCTSGNRNDKNYVKRFMADLLQVNYKLNDLNIDKVIPFAQRERLSIHDKFDIVLYLFSCRYGEEGLSSLIDTYNLAQPRSFRENDEEFIYAITEQDIEHIFYLEYRPLRYAEKLEIVVQRVYQHYKGFSVTDEIRDQRIDGISGGVNGVPERDIKVYEHSKEVQHPYDEEMNSETTILSNYESVWILYKGKSIHLSFLSFGSEGELKRVCQNIYKYNQPGQLSEASGYKINEMQDGSRVVVVRPPFAETWAFFVRKFDVSHTSLEQLIQGNNAYLPIHLLKFLMKGSRITAITGAQGSGKTTLLMALVKHIYASYTLRVQEMSFELHLRKLYSRRNILSFRETETVSGQSGLDLQKKTDGTVNILGEVATDEVAAWMIQMSQVASLFTLFTHHAKTFRDLIQSLRNSLLKTGMFRDEHIAELQVVNVIQFDVHLRCDMAGNRYIERITECIASQHPRETGTSYNERTIIEYREGTYIAVEPLTSQTTEDMSRQMTTGDRERFHHFLNRTWGERVGA